MSNTLDDNPADQTPLVTVLSLNTRPLQADQKTEELRREVKAAGGTWRDVTQLSEAELAQLVRQDKVQPVAGSCSAVHLASAGVCGPCWLRVTRVGGCRAYPPQQEQGV